MAHGVLNRIMQVWTKIRLQPIHVFCLHHICAEFDAESMNSCDWMSIDEFKKKIIAMRQSGIAFISLNEAYQHISNDRIRCQKYAVLTFDDGYATLKEILPWLEEQQIPSTLFINGKYLDGTSYRNNPNERYLTRDELWVMTSSYIEIGSHGWEHTDAFKMSDDEFKHSVEENVKLLSTHPRYIPYHAYTWGHHTAEADKQLKNVKTGSMVPILMDGILNYNDNKYIHRELLSDSHKIR